MIDYIDRKPTYLCRHPPPQDQEIVPSFQQSSRLDQIQVRKCRKATNLRDLDLKAAALAKLGITLRTS